MRFFSKENFYSLVLSFFSLPYTSRRSLLSVASRENRIPVRRDYSSHLGSHPWRVSQRLRIIWGSSSLLLPKNWLNCIQLRYTLIRIPDILGYSHSHLILRDFQRTIVGRIHHVLFDHGIHDDLRALYLLLCLILRLHLVSFARLNVRDILFLLFRCRFRVNRRCQCGFLPRVRRFWKQRNTFAYRMTSNEKSVEIEARK